MIDKPHSWGSLWGAILHTLQHGCRSPSLFVPPRAACGAASLPWWFVQGATVCTPMLLPHRKPQLPLSTGQGLCLHTLFENPWVLSPSWRHRSVGARGQFLAAGFTALQLCYVGCLSMSLHRCLLHETEALFSLQAQKECKSKQVLWDISLCPETSTKTTCNTN